jgi:hypothetical protein
MKKSLPISLQNRYLAVSISLLPITVSIARMKRILATIALLLISVSFMVAQGNVNGNSNANASSNGVNNAYGYVPGGAIPNPLVVHILQEARSWGQQTR